MLRASTRFSSEVREPVKVRVSSAKRPASAGARGSATEGESSKAAPRRGSAPLRRLEERVPCSTSRTWRRSARRVVFFSKDGRGVDQVARPEDLVQVSDAQRDAERLEDRRGPRTDDRRSR
jgi:hypothetical protein